MNSPGLDFSVTNAVIKIQDKSGAPKAKFLTGGANALLIIVMVGLVGGILWNLVTWFLGLPSSSLHALFGLISAAIAAVGVRRCHLGGRRQQARWCCVVRIGPGCSTFAERNWR